MSLKKLNKSKSILKILDALQNYFGENKIQISDYWDADLAAIGIMHGDAINRLFYICCYSEADGYFNLIVEAFLVDKGVYKDLASFEHVTIKQIIEVIRQHIE